MVGVDVVICRMDLSESLLSLKHGSGNQSFMSICSLSQACVQVQPRPAAEVMSRRNEVGSGTVWLANRRFGVGESWERMRIEVYPERDWSCMVTCSFFFFADVIASAVCSAELANFASLLCKHKKWI
jgi:hypothetical protein